MGSLGVPLITGGSDRVFEGFIEFSGGFRGLWGKHVGI